MHHASGHSAPLCLVGPCLNGSLPPTSPSPRRSLPLTSPRCGGRLAWTRSHVTPHASSCRKRPAWKASHVDSVGRLAWRPSLDDLVAPSGGGCNRAEGSVRRVIGRACPCVHKAATRLVRPSCAIGWREVYGASLVLGVEGSLRGWRDGGKQRVEGSVRRVFGTRPAHVLTRWPSALCPPMCS